MSTTAESFCEQGARINLATTPLNTSEAKAGLAAAVDYRGDVTVILKTGAKVEGFVYNRSADHLEIYPAQEVAPRTIALSDIEAIEFTGEDPSRGKGWEDWQTKNAAEKAAIKALPVV